MVLGNRGERLPIVIRNRNSFYGLTDSKEFDGGPTNMGKSDKKAYESGLLEILKWTIGTGRWFGL